ncbi:hypothetical protein EMIHUDRAFT_230210 [Emiliania huxleyi CCMP1516]|uniref:Fatty acid hydroxylase domain-containing protein n=2 Tax=Emiliania huxleyi TaxID=2903 RepID=A0A0D3KAR1_EMIH1|nr:hypothetical protein EMIHUDRAFT_230210 [Emiliania huxleyi CCMP1516]EOD32846.1 hypothetical protein EMIHUDRAFT_230210 [Emiliania huxleyi CCMP1516]|eukprot:XP_005785275.1 hypothetical protein EMIHUDRAFT_230210 [Emiliania huxleyi CCMP1516]
MVLCSIVLLFALQRFATGLILAPPTFGFVRGQRAATRLCSQSLPVVHAGPIALSWAAGGLTLLLQHHFTDWTQAGADAAYLSQRLQDVGVGPLPQPDLQVALLWAYLYAMSVGVSFAMPGIVPAAQSKADAEGASEPLKHALTAVDLSYIALNSLCLPGLFYHFVTLLRSWGLDFDAPACGIYPEKPLLLLTETLPELAMYLPLYFITYEFVPVLYKWVHKHHHQQTYPDRAVIDTLNTGCVESQVGLYSQLALLWAFGKLGLDRLEEQAPLPAMVVAAPALSAKRVLVLGWFGSPRCFRVSA